MIILDEQQPQKGDPLSSLPVARLSTSSHEYPPPYAHSTTITAVASNTRVDSNPEHDHEGDDASTIVAKEKKRRLGKGARAVLCLLIAFVLYSAILTALLVLKPWKRRWKSADYIPPNLNFWRNNSPSSPPPPPPNLPISDYTDGKPILCNAWDVNISGFSRLQYQYPNNTSSIFVSSYSSRLLRGRFDVWAHDRTDLSIQIEVSVSGQFSGGAGGVKVCIIQGNVDGDYGLEIFNTGRTSTTTQLDVVISLSIPKDIPLDTLSTNLPHFSHSLQKENPQNALVINTVKLQGPVSHLIMQMDETKSFTVDTSAPIRGAMRVSEYLHIHSLSAEIVANITLAYKGSPMTVMLDSNHAPIGAIVKVINLPKKFNNPNQLYPISISACTSYAPLAVAVDYPYSYPPIALQLNAQTSYSPLLARLPPPFQGSFVCVAQGSEAKVSRTPNVKDPSGENHTRAVLLSKDDDDGPQGDQHGTVSWNDLPGKMRKQLGTVNVQSMGGSATLMFDGPDSPLIQGIDDWPHGWGICP